MSHAMAWLSHHACRAHDMGALHPESPARLDAIEDRLRASGVGDLLWRVEAPAARREELLRVHDAAHVDMVFAHGNAARREIDGDTVQTRHTLPAALHAAGASVKAVDLVLDREASAAFCAVRPPGHHAERDRAMGFCFFNNVAVGAAHALHRGLSRVAILDFDLHYGNGTADIFEGDERVMLYSTYQHPLYPNWTGAPHASNLIDVPMRAYAGSEAFRAGVTAHWLPALSRQRPQLILVSAGFDAHAKDPMGDLRLGFHDYAWIGEVIRDVARQHCGGQVVATLEGGYDLPTLGRCVETFLQPFLGP